MKTGTFIVVMAWLTAVGCLGWQAAAEAQDVGATVPRPPAATQPAETDPEAQRLLEEARQQRAQMVDPAQAVLEAERNRAQVEWDRAKAAYHDAVRKARQQMFVREGELPSTAQFSAARRFLDEAEEALKQKEIVADPAELRSLMGDVADLRAYLGREEQTANAERARRDREAAQKETEDLAIKAAELERQRVATLMEQAHTARMNKNYPVVRQLLEQVLKIDPKHRQAGWMLADAKVAEDLQTQQKINDRKDEWTRDALLAVRDALTPFDEPMVYPPASVWHTLVEKRKQHQAGLPVESPADQRVREQMEKIVPEIQFNQITFEQALNFLRNLQRININPNWGAMEELGISKATEVTLQLRDVSFETALKELLAKAAGREDTLDYMIREGVVKISKKDDLATLHSVLVYDVRDLVHPLKDFRAPAMTRTMGGAGAGAGVGVGVGVGVPGGGAGGGLFGDDDATTGQTQTSEEEYTARVNEVMSLIRGTVLPDSWAPTGLGNVTPIDGLLVVKQTANGHRELIKLLQQLREHSRMQVCIEARFLTIESSFLEDIGFDLDFIFNRGDTTGKFREIPVDVTAFEKEITTPAGTTILAPIGNADIFQVGNSSLVISGSIFDDLQVDFFLRATQAHRQSSKLNSLRVTLLNGHEAYVLVETLTDYVSDLNPAVATGATGYRPGVSQFIKGISFGVRATVTADRKYVIMTVYPTLRDDALAANSPFEFNVGGTPVIDPATGLPMLDPVTGQPILVGGTKLSIMLTEQKRQEVRTTVIVPDQGTLLLGGQRIADELEIEQGVPILSKIPIIKRAFTSRNFVKRERTLLILIRPQILIQDEMEP